MSEIVSFGEWVQTRRNQLRLSRRELAEQVDCAPITIKKIERDERRPSVLLAELLAAKLQIPKSNQEDFIRRARGEFVPHFGSPAEMSLAEAQAPPGEEDARQHNLPVQTTPFIGREAELREITTYLADPACRLLTILGAGGMGKTRLAIEVGLRHASPQQDGPTFTDGITYVALAPLNAADFSETINPLAAALADSLRISFYGDESPEYQLQAYLRRKEMLLIFDNFEHLLEAVDFAGNLLSYAPDIKLLVTSRERINLQEEWLFPLQGLSFPKEQSEVETTDALSFSAIDLFAQRAKQVQPRFDPEAERATMVRISQLVEGMPLGLELAAAMVRHMPCQAIAQEIKRELDFLTTNLRNVPARHRSLRAVFTYSWQRLTEDERMVLQKLSVFRGGFEREAAQTVADAAFPLLSSLVDKSLLRVTATGRYEIHELMRQFAAEKLAQTPEQESEVRDKHSRFYLEFHGTWELPFVDLFGIGSKNTRLALKNNIDNIRVAWQWGVARNWQALLKSAAIALFSFYELQGWFLEGQEVFSQAYLTLKPHCPSDETVESDFSHLQSCLLLAFLQSGLAHFQARLGHLEQAVNTFEESLSLFPESGELAREEETLWMKMWCLNIFVNVLIWQGDFIRAGAIYEKITQLYHNADDNPLHYIALIVRGDGAQHVGNYDEAERWASENNRFCKQIGNQILPAYNFRTLGRVAMARGRYEEAETYLQKSLAICIEYELRSQEVLRLIDLGDVARLQGKFDEAQAYFEEGRTLATEINMPWAISSTLWGLGNLAEGIGDYAAARYYFNESKEKSGIRLWSPGGPNWVALALGELQAAREQFLAELQTNVQLGQLSRALETLAGLAHVQALAGKPDQAFELIAMILRHPASLQESKNRVLKLREELTAELPIEMVREAEARGRALDLWETAEALLSGL